MRVESERYSPPKIRYWTQRALVVTGLVLGLAAYVKPVGKLVVLKDWHRCCVVGGPLLGVAWALSAWRPKRDIEVPQGYTFVERVGEPGQDGRSLPARLAHGAAYGLSRSWGKGMVYQGLATCHFPNQEYRAAREEAARLFGFEFVKVESFGDRGDDSTLLLDGIRLRGKDFKKPEVPADEPVKELVEESLEALNHGLNLPRAQEGDTAVFFTPYAGYSRYMMTTALIYAQQGYDVMLVDTRGFGRSEGVPYSAGNRVDVESIVEAAKGWGAKRMIFHGRCVGSFNALYGANYAKRYGMEVRACVADRHVMRLSEVVCNQGVVFKGIGKLGDYVEPHDIAEQLEELGEIPLGLIHGTRDTFARRRNMEEAREKSTSPKVLELEMTHRSEWWKASHREPALRFLFEDLLGA